MTIELDLVIEESSHISNKICQANKIIKLPNTIDSYYNMVQCSGLILDLHPANERRRYKVMPPLIGWAQT